MSQAIKTLVIQFAEETHVVFLFPTRGATGQLAGGIAILGEHQHSAFVGRKSSGQCQSAQMRRRQAPERAVLTPVVVRPNDLARRHAFVELVC